ncbi:MAG: lysostaphin resistance A-like protein [Thermodesulfobacteriota bacterium]
MLPKELSPPSDEFKGKPWGLWATFGFSAIIFVLLAALQFAVMIAFVSFAKAEHPELDLEAYAKSLPSNGFWVAMATIVAGLICIPLTIFFARLRRNISLKDYIGFREPSKSEWVRWLLILVALLFLSDMTSFLLHQPIVPPFMEEAYRTAFFLPALLFAIIIVAPIFEEIFVRGFLFQGIRYSRLGSIGAIGITSSFWAVIHLQYDAYGMATIFVLGLLFGIARLKTDSIHLVMVMHSLGSFVATVETILYVHFT